MTVHIGATPGDIAETVLMPGDPLRAKWAAETFLDAPREVTRTRGMLGFTGTWKGQPVTIQGSGMGMPSASIYANELIRDYGVQTLIRIGSAGAMQAEVKIRDVVLAITATSVATPSGTIFHPVNFAPSANWTLLRNAALVAEKRAIPTHIGGIYSSDTFYDERSDLTAQMTRHGILAVEMETAEIYTVAARYQRRALSILTISDHLLTGEELPSDQRERTFGDMVEIALAAAFPNA